MKSIFLKNIYKNEANGYCVSSFASEDATMPEAARGRYIKGRGYTFTATGYQLPETDAVEVDLKGSWSRYKGTLQLAVEGWEEVLPQSAEGIEKYLASGIVKGIGPKTAEKVVAKFGTRTFEIMDQYPDKLKEIRGITDKKLQGILDSYQGSRMLRDLAAWLMPFGVTQNKVAKIWREFGTDALETVKHRPFALCSISGFGFETVDKIARSISCRPDDPMRIEGAILYVMEEEMKKGHLYLEKEAYEKAAYDCLNHGFQTEAVSQREIVAGFYQLAVSRKLVADGNAIYRQDAYRAEEEAAEAAAELLAQQCSRINIDLLLEQAQRELGIPLSAKQADAVRMVFGHMLSIITGGPGTGKTTVEKIILYIDKKLGGGSVMLMAPTGRASRRMAESTGVDTACTLHSGLAIAADEENLYESSVEPLDAGLIITDECSMVDMFLGSTFLTRIGKGTRCVLIGDVNQLSSVGPGNVFRELINSGVVPVTRLDMVFRQGANSRIAVNADLMQKNSTKLDYGTDFALVPAETDREAQELIRGLYLQEISVHGTDQVQILSPLRERSQVSKNALNGLLHDLVNPPEAGKAEMRLNGRVFRVGDKVIQNKNKNGISNGDTGYIREIYLDEDDTELALISFGDREVEYDSEAMSMIELAYGLTIHKSQGSEYRVVIMPWLNMFYNMLLRNVLYTGITRAKEKVIIVGQKQAVCRAIHNTKSSQRNTKLGERVAKKYYALSKSPEERCEQLVMNL